MLLMRSDRYTLKSWFYTLQITIFYAYLRLLTRHSAYFCFKFCMNNTTNQTGNLGEQLARHYLEQQGLMHLHSNWRMGKKEVDLIMHKDGVLHFIEVKSQSSPSLATPDRRVTAAKLSNMRQVASGFLQTHPGWRFIQFDIVAVVMEAGKDAAFFWIEDLT